jgi:hypothetical protein
LDAPRYIPERGEITMTYVDRTKTRLDLACAGRGLQQTLLLLAHLAANPNSVILIDEPDAHLEILRQRQIYDLMCRFAAEHGSQVIAASHSEVVLNEAAGRDAVIAFVGKPHRIDDRGHQLLKSLKDIGYDHFYQAEQTGWVLYLEGSTDLSILRAFAGSPSTWVINLGRRAATSTAFERQRGILWELPSLTGFKSNYRRRSSWRNFPGQGEKLRITYANVMYW